MAIYFFCFLGYALRRQTFCYEVRYSLNNLGFCRAYYRALECALFFNRLASMFFT